MTKPAETSLDIRATNKEWIGLAVLALPTLLLSLDLSVLYLALPMLSADLGADSTAQLWITDIYGFLIAGFLVTMGTLGDRIGRRKLLLIGGVAFGVASVVAAYSTSTEMLIATRALLGVAGATLMPSTLALISNMFRNPQQRGLAIAAWMTCFMGGMTLGPVIGGILLEHYWWGSAFLIGVPVMIVLVTAGPFLLPEYKDENAGKLDLLSVVMSMATVLPLIYGLKELAKNGLGAVAVLSILVGVAVGVAFLRRQRVIPSPMIDLKLFQSASFSGSLSIMLMTGLLMGGTFFMITQSLQLVLGLSPLEAGLSLIPQAVVMAAASMLAPLVARRVRPASVVSTGLLVSASGFVLLAFSDATTSAVQMLFAFGIIAAGMGITGPLVSDLIIGSAPVERAGSAASLHETSGEFGIALGVATIGSLATWVYRQQLNGAGLATEGLAAAREGLTFAVAAGGAVVAPAQEAFIDGLSVVSVVAAVGMVALSIVALRTMGHVPASNNASAPVETTPVG